MMDDARARLVMREHHSRSEINEYGLASVRCECGRSWPCVVRQDVTMTHGEPPWWVRLIDTAQRHEAWTAFVGIGSFSAGSAMILAGAYDRLWIDDQQLLAITLVLLLAMFTALSVLSRRR